MQKRFSTATNMLLNEYIRDFKETPLYIDGEERVRTYKELKDQDQLLQLIYRDGEVNYTNRWVVKLLEDFVTGHEGDYGHNHHVNHLSVILDLAKRGELYLLFEEHYGPNGYL
ncbi:hypothetical protein LZ575_19910 [Antarcticibacterium sp. 1MA-6-2]|uniref:hypothetical protein n=1 Tax=Antarcticibacterium sp. 1MA-6-2 TaxID=2908210 RepID=UPI001F452DC5|nr:hypothetical protein [Antarcticibacterium sp. 1MA-6-2]UJH90928.1 hypothetical protein LZ575_19910 [Antarcticibacterium sp. 1MA-6-2]